MWKLYKSEEKGGGIRKNINAVLEGPCEGKHFPQESDSRVREQPCQVEGKSSRLICDESGHQIQSC